MDEHADVLDTHDMRVGRKAGSYLRRHIGRDDMPALWNHDDEWDDATNLRTTSGIGTPTLFCSPKGKIGPKGTLIEPTTV